MLSSRRSWMLLIRFSLRRRHGFVVPVPLFLLDILLDAVADMGCLAELLTPLWRPKLKGAAVLLGLPRELLDSLRTSGKWRMLELDTDEVRMIVDFI